MSFFSSIVATPTDAPSEPLNEVTLECNTSALSTIGAEVWTDAETYAGRHSINFADESATSHSFTMDESDGLVAGETYNCQFVATYLSTVYTSDVFTFTIADPSADVTFDAASGSSSGDSLTYSHTTGVDATVLVVFTLTDSFIAPSAVTYNGVSLGAPVEDVPNLFGAYWRMYVMQNPPAGAHNVVVTAAGAAIYSQAITANGANTSDAVRDVAGAYDTAWPAELTVDSSVHDLVIHWYDIGTLAGDTITPTTGGTTRVSMTPTTRFIALQTRAGTSSLQTTGWQKIGAAGDYMHIAASLKP